MKRSSLDEFCDMLDTYGGRDKVIRTLCYTTKLACGLYESANPDFSKKLGIFSSKMSATRATLRLLDDWPMFQHTLRYGLGHKEPDKAMAVMGLLANIVDNIYYPVEKVCWLAEHRVISVRNPSKWDTASSICWVLSIFLNLLRILRNVTLMEQYSKTLDKAANNSNREERRKLLWKQQQELLSVVRLSLDLTQAVSTLPKGWLWGGNLSTLHIGFIGTLSSFIGLYQYFAKKHGPA
ncbi:peroxisomal membrane protein 11C [Phlebotomus argentipes]|uniref:peroxisomal membrane protein 11C n=1 Tax=Phlebotomus argentipes TaxID=94469 RepID=UPI0028935D13|nr:peroxisomal membrane protein 11C [Phlebotomus argentipes]